MKVSLCLAWQQLFAAETRQSDVLLVDFNLRLMICEIQFVFGMAAVVRGRVVRGRSCTWQTHDVCDQNEA